MNEMKQLTNRKTVILYNDKKTVIFWKTCIKSFFFKTNFTVWFYTFKNISFCLPVSSNKKVYKKVLDFSLHEFSIKHFLWLCNYFSKYCKHLIETIKIMNVRSRFPGPKTILKFRIWKICSPDFLRASLPLQFKYKIWSHLFKASHLRT